METEIIVAIVSAIGMCVGSVSGILISNRLSNYRIQQLERKVDDHNQYARRLPVVEEQIKVINHRLEDVEGST